MSRTALSQLVASRWRHGARAQQPHGSNCIDIDNYRIRPKADVKLLGSQPIHTRLAHVPHSRWRVRATPNCNSEFVHDACWRIWRAVSAATNVQDEGRSQLCLEGSACTCLAGSLANNNIGTCQSVSEFMNSVLQVAGSNCRHVFGAS